MEINSADSVVELFVKLGEDFFVESESTFSPATTVSGPVTNGNTKTAKVFWERGTRIKYKDCG